MEKRIAYVLEQIRLPVEQELWQTISGIEGVSERLGKTPKVLLIGTDSGLTLARSILETNSEIEITIIERSKRVVQEAEKSLPAPIKLISGDFLDLNLSRLPDQGLVISKHLIHFLPESDIQAFIVKALELSDAFYASVPPFINILVDRNLKKRGINYRKIPPKFRGTLYYFEQK